MGEVYEVKDADDSVWALKVLASDMMDKPGAVDRFGREARVMSEMDHEGIVKVDLTGEDEGRHWLRMEIAEGRLIGGKKVTTLQDFMQASNGRLSERDSKNLLGSLLDSLEYAHGRGLVHRDLKPANVLFFGEKPKIADFGLVDAAGAEWMETQVKNSMVASMMEDTLLDSDASASGSRSKALMGTFAYMSPEQKEGREADARSDLYAVGLIGREAVTGVKSLGMERPTEMARGIHPGWDVWVRKAVANNAGERFQSAHAMRSALLFPKAKKRGSLFAFAAIGVMALCAALFFLPGNPFFGDSEIGSVEEVSESSSNYISGKEDELAQLEDGESGLRVTIIPPVPKAVVRIGGKRIEVTGGREYFKELLPGTEELSVESPGFVDYFTTVPLEKGWNSHTVRLADVRGHLVVRSNPGVKVMAFGKDGTEFDLGLTDAKGMLTSRKDLAFGFYDIRLSKRNHTEWSDRIRLISGEAFKLTENLDPNPGKLSVTVGTSGVSIIIPGQKRRKAPLQDVEVPAEVPLEVTALLEGYRSKTKSIRLEAGGSKTIAFDALVKESGSLWLIIPEALADEKGLKVFLDGTDMTARKKRFYSALWRFEELSVGQRLVKLTHPEYEDWEGIATIEDGRKSEVRAVPTLAKGLLTVSCMQPGTSFELRIADQVFGPYLIESKSRELDVASRMPITLSYRRAGHRSSVLLPFEIEPKGRKSVDLPKLQVEQGWVTLTGEAAYLGHSEARILLNDKNSFQKSTLLPNGTVSIRLGPFLPGIHKISIKHPNYAHWDKSFEIKDGQMLNFETKPLLGSAILKIAKPVGSQIIINEQNRGTAPTEITLPAPEEYEITLRRDGYDDANYAIALKANATLKRDYPDLVHTLSRKLREYRSKNGGTKIVMRGMAISDLSALSDYSDITELDLGNNKIKDLTPLSKLKNLRRLDLSGNVVYDLKPLGKLTSLEYLNLSFNYVGDIIPLLPLQNLKELDLRRQVWWGEAQKSKERGGRNNMITLNHRFLLSQELKSCRIELDPER